MPKKLEWDYEKDRQIIESEHKTWNQSTLVVSTGNIISPGFWGRCVRAYNETECNGRDWELGHLQNFDLGGAMFDNVPEYVKKYTFHPDL